MEIQLTDILIHLLSLDIQPPSIEQAEACQTPEMVLEFAQAQFDLAFKAGYLMAKSEEAYQETAVLTPSEF